MNSEFLTFPSLLIKGLTEVLGDSFHSLLNGMSPVYIPCISAWIVGEEEVVLLSLSSLCCGEVVDKGARKGKTGQERRDTNCNDIPSTLEIE